jgi:hypothetical protein
MQLSPQALPSVQTLQQLPYPYDDDSDKSSKSEVKPLADTPNFWSFLPSEIELVEPLKFVGASWCVGMSSEFEMSRASLADAKLMKLPRIQKSKNLENQLIRTSITKLRDMKITKVTLATLYSTC